MNTFDLKLSDACRFVGDTRNGVRQIFWQGTAQTTYVGPAYEGTHLMFDRTGDAPPVELIAFLEGAGYKIAYAGEPGPVEVLPPELMPEPEPEPEPTP